MSKKVDDNDKEKYQVEPSNDFLKEEFDELDMQCMLCDLDMELKGEDEWKKE